MTQQNTWGVLACVTTQHRITELLVAHRDLIEAQERGNQDAEVDAARRMQLALDALAPGVAIPDKGAEQQVFDEWLQRQLSDSSPQQPHWTDYDKAVANFAWMARAARGVLACAPGSTDAERAAWLADKIAAGGDYAKEAAAMLRRWPAGVEASDKPVTEDGNG